MSSASNGLDLERLAANLARAKAGIAEACSASSRPIDSVRLVAVSKYVDAEATAALAQLGCQDLGESRPQTLWEKHDALQSKSAIHWHMIGHLQRNKVARTVPMLSWLHSLDSLRLAEAVEDALAKIDRILKVLIEVNVTQDREKTGLAEADVADVLRKVLGFPHLEVHGLMAMSTDGASETTARGEFARVRELRDRLQLEFGDQVQLNELSMGMSGDYAWAIAEGSTMVRLGSMLWEGVVRGESTAG